MSKIYLSLTGGLGNQLYIAATGLGLAKIFKKKIIFDTSTYKRYKLHSLLINNLIPSLQYEANNYIYKGYPLLSKEKSFLKLVREKSPSYDQNIINSLKNTSPFFDYFLKGYFQSLNYFSHILPDLKNEINKSLESLNKELIKNNIRDI